MSDSAGAAKLELTDPNLTWRQIVKKYKAQGYEGDNLWKKIIEPSQKSRQSVNKSLNLGE